MRVLLEKVGLTAPELSQDPLVEVSELFHWRRASIIMAGDGVDFFTDLTTAVTARTLSAAVCGLLLADAGSSSTVTKT